MRANPASSLEELNERFWKWLEEDYNRKPHASLDGKIPLDVYLSQCDQIRMVEDPAALDALFLKREMRTVKHDATFTLGKRLYQVPERFINRKVEIRYDENSVHIYEEGKAVALATLVNLNENAHVKRNRSSLSFHDLMKGEDKE